MANQYLKIFTQKNIAVLLLLGFASGLPLALTGGTLQAWVTDSGFDIKTIGFMTLVGQAYVFKFLWAPLMDRYVPPFFGRRRGWLVITQLLLAGSLFAMSFLDPKQHLFWLATLAVAVAFFSASQDIVFDAYKTDILPGNERGIGAAVSVLGYRIAMLVSGGLALLIAGMYGDWRFVYQLMALMMLISAAVSCWASEPKDAVVPPRSLEQAIIVPFNDFFNRNNAWLILLLIVFYKMGDSFAASLSTAFLMKGPQFSLEEIGVINKSLGLIATIIGAIFGGVLMLRMSLFRALLIFGLLQAVSNFGYWLLAVTPLDVIRGDLPHWLSAVSHMFSQSDLIASAQRGLNAVAQINDTPSLHHLLTDIKTFHLTKGHLILSSVIFLENICGGMGTSAFVALLMTLCNRSFSASQFAFLSALSAVGRVYVGPVSGWLVEGYGWADFYLFTVVISAPGLILLLMCKQTLIHTQQTDSFAARTHFSRQYRNVLRILAIGAVGLLISLLIMALNGLSGMLFNASLLSVGTFNGLLLQISAVVCVLCLIGGGALDYLALRKDRHTKSIG
jgi:PAT family beta-lactamase induction signal transducer AmpG